MNNQEKLYAVAKGNIGVHCTLNASVPAEVGCAEALSYNIRQAGLTVPSGGIAGTYNMLEFLKSDVQFQEVDSPEPGDIIIDATGTGNGSVEGHTGIVMQSGICSNDSATGLWLERWLLPNWLAYYTQTGGMKSYYFRAV